MARCAVCGKIKVPQGVGSALKPAMELICLARKPLDGTVAANVLRHGTGALNIDACRVPAGANVKFDRAPGGVSRENWRKGTCVGPAQPAGNRWPANCVHDGSPEVEEAFARFGERASGQLKPEHQARGGFAHTNCYHAGSTKGGDGSWEANTGSASRFFFCAKADASDRAGSRHPTVKPTALMRWLVQLVTPPGGTTLDPFAGTGSTGLAADQLGMSAVLIERDAKYAADAERKIKQDAPLFACVRQPTPDLDAAYQRQPGLWEAAE